MWWWLLKLSLLGVSGRSESVPRQINPVSVLLPYTANAEHRVNVTLEAFGGCYRWRVQRPSVVKVRDLLSQEETSELEGRHTLLERPVSEPSDALGWEDLPECHNAISVAQFLAPGGPDRDKSWVFAEDIRTGSGVKCEVYVAPIDRFVIETTAKSLTVGGADTLKVRAFDRDGNVFTSLQGLRFDWDLQNTNAIAIASLNNDVYRPTAVRRRIHQSGEQSDIILLKGLANGRSRVRARLLEAGYENVPVAFVDLDVMEPIVAVPSSVYVPPLSDVQLGVRVLHGKETPSQAALVTVPHKDFLWSVDDADANLIQVEARQARVAVRAKDADSHEDGHAVFVSDKRNVNNTDSTSLYIAHPSKINALQSPLHLIKSNLTPQSPIASLEKEMELLSRREHWPVAINPSTRDSLTVKVRSKAGGLKKRWALVRGVPTIALVDLRGLRDQSLYVPENANFAVRLESEEDKSMTLLWQSQNSAVLLLRPETISSGTIEWTFENVTSSATKDTYTPATPVYLKQRYVVVEPLQLTGLPPMIQGTDNDTKTLASPVPLILPLSHRSTFTLTGGTGTYRLDSSDASICRLAKLSSSSGETVIEVETGSTPGMATLTMTDEANLGNFYRIHCVTGYVSAIRHRPVSRQLPLNASAESIFVPVEATLDLRSIVPSFPPAWKSQGDRDIELFTRCAGLDESSLEASSSPAQLSHSALRNELAVISTTRPCKDRMYCCGLIEIAMPAAPLQATLVTSLGDSLTVGTDLEFYAPLAAHLPDKERLSKFKLPPIHPPNRTISVTSDRIQNSLALAVGSTTQLNLLGGPSLQPGSFQSVSFDVSLPDKLAVTKSKHANPPEVRHLIKDGGYAITCLDIVTLVDLTFTVHTTLPDGGSDILTTTLHIGCAVPEVLRVLPDDSEQSARVSLLPAALTEVDAMRVRQTAGALVTTIGLRDRSEAKNAEARLFMAAEKEHAFRLAAWDGDGRPLLSVASFQPAWGLFDHSAEAALTSESKFEDARLRLPRNKVTGHCILSAAIAWTGDFPQHIYASLNKQEASILRATATKVKTPNWLDVKSDKHLQSAIELSISPQPQLLPKMLRSSALVANSDMTYRVLAVHGSGRARYSLMPVGGGRATVTLPEIVFVEQHSPSSSLPRRSPALKSSDGKSLGSVVDLTGWSAEEGEVARAVGNLTAVNWADMYLRASSAGHFTLTMQDNSLLGGEPASLPLQFSSLASLQLHLLEGGVVKATNERLNEVESETTYEIQLVATGDKGVQFSPRVTRHLKAEWSAHPSTWTKIERSPQDENVVTLRATRTGKAVLNARIAVQPSRLQACTPLELLFHKPLAVHPREVVLLPGGHTWQPSVTGGAAAASAYALSSSDASVAAPRDSDDLAVRPYFASGARGTATVTVVSRTDPSKPLSTKNSHLKVTVAYPSRAAIYSDGKPRSGQDSVTPLTLGVPARLVGALLTSDGLEFTLPNLLAPSGLRPTTTSAGGVLQSVSGTGYVCKYNWASHDPSLLSFIDDSQNIENVETSESPSLEMFPPLVHKIYSSSQIAAFAIPLKVGTAKITFTAECIDKKGWGAPFQRWTDSATLSVLISEKANRLKEVERSQSTQTFTEVITPIVKTQAGPFSIMPYLKTAQRNLGMEDTMFSSGGVEPLRVLANSEYELTPLHWSNEWTYKVACDSLDLSSPRITGRTQTCPPRSAIEQIVLPTNQSLHITTGTTQAAESLLILKGSARHQSMVIPVVISDPYHLQIAPTEPTGSLLGSTSLMTKSYTRPLILRTGSSNQFHVSVLDDSNSPILLPPKAEFEVVSSHPAIVSVVDVSGDTVTLTGKVEGCAGVGVSMKTAKGGRVQDVMTICTEGDASGRNAPVGETGPEEIVKAALLKPWVTEIFISLPWTIIGLCGIGGLIATYGIAGLLNSRRLSQQTTPPNSTKKMAEALRHDWATAPTPASRAQNNLSAFPSGRRTYASQPSTGLRERSAW